MEVLNMSRTQCLHAALKRFKTVSVITALAAVLAAADALGLADPKAVADQRPAPSDTPRPERASKTDGEVLDPIGVITAACHPMKNLGHAFDLDDVKTLSQDPGNLVIVAHGIAPDLPGFDRFLVHEEHVPVFVSKTQPVGDLSKDQVFKVIQGEITDWKQLGGKPGRINLYLHGGELQKEKLESIVSHDGGDAEKIKDAGAKLEPTYQSLAAAADKDPNAFCVGLQSLKQGQLKPIKLQGVAPLKPDAGDDYPLKAPVYVFVRKDDARAKAVEQAFLNAVEEREALAAAGKNLADPSPQDTGQGAPAAAAAAPPDEKPPKPAAEPD
jgi:hypothetical protein